jgi:hypothetical protein
MKFWKIILVAILAVGVTGILDNDAEARRGGGFSSSRSFSSSSRSTPSRSTWGGSTRTTPSRSTWGGSTRSSSSKSGLSTSGSRTTSKPARSAADTALYEKAAKSNTAYTSKANATTAFKSKYADQYKSKYDTKPATRPDHIPPKTTVGGKSYDISYNQQYGGYGYMGPSGSWVMYNAMADAVMIDTLMRRNNYYYDRPGSVTYMDSGGGLRWMMWLGLIVFGVIVLCAFFSWSTS